ncbi:hypothetical protein PISMIDRAFT_20102 [Pisolithus microcarpus 441]|uniref:Uncharacterized protein n=1 Tax=Pisolithus microcarpus 441 TaxID=765257 RepID=A0A0C9Y9R1_9AGAM|nr:hypothetical protein PISMIDRAFT_20102 [Pisolithus microcarpus 441]
MAHYLIISGIPDSILMLVMHLETPHETFAYLENRYGSIPRPETWLAAMQQSDLSSERDATGESSQEARDSNNEPENLPGGQEDFPNFPSDCAETTDGHAEPETEVMDARQVEGNLLKVADRAMDLERPDELVDAPREEKAPDLEDKSLDGGDSDPGYWEALSNNGYELIDLPIEDTRCLSMDDETVTNVPVPPGIYAELPILDVECSTLQYQPPARNHSATSTSFILPVLELTPKEPDKAETGGGCNDAVSKDPVGSQGVEKTMLADSRGQHGEHEAKRPRHSPAPPAPSPNGILDMPTPFTDLRRRGRLKTKAENVSNACSRRNAYRARAALMRPPPPLFTPSKRLGYLMGGSWIRLHAPW